MQQKIPPFTRPRSKGCAAMPWLLGTLILTETVTSNAAVDQIIVQSYFRVEVGTSSDTANPRGCSLRQAIETLNNNTLVGDCQRDLQVGDRPNLIVFNPGIIPAQICLNRALVMTGSAEV